jgi:hypothetical protein
MGIEKFFNSIKKTYGDKIINKFDWNKHMVKSFFPHKYFYLDFNSIIHNISQSISNSIISLYHLYLISNIKPDIFNLAKEQFIEHLNNLSTYDDFYIKDNIRLPDQLAETTDTTNTNTDKYEYIIQFKDIKLDDLNESFFKLISIEDNIDKLIIHKVCLYIKWLITLFPNLKQLYIAIDGVPLYAKMIEQRKRRTIGYIIENVRESLLEYYKKELDIQPTIYADGSKTDIYYNHYKFEQFIKKLKFNKNKISPATSFMTNLQDYMKKYLDQYQKEQHNNKQIHNKINIIIDSYTNFGEGEKKIVIKINEQIQQIKLDSSDIIVYSPDADVILLMLIELVHMEIANIHIMRYDQQLKHIDIINIGKLKDVILEYMGYNKFTLDVQNKVIVDIVMLFTILGNDFLPKLDEINTSKHIKSILDAYILLNNNSKTTDNLYNNIFIYTTNSSINITTNTINWELLKQYFIYLKHQLITDSESKAFKFGKEPKVLNLNKSSFIGTNVNKKIRYKEWKLEPDQIVNSNALDFYQHIFNVENMIGSYNPLNTLYEKPSISSKIKIRSCRKYLEGYIWLAKYYLEHDQSYKLYTYTYDFVPTINDIIETINQIQNNKTILKKINNNLLKTFIFEEKKYFKPEEQLAIISPFDIINIIDKQYLDNKKFSKWLDLYNEKINDINQSNINLKITNGKLNIYDYINCENAFYLNKCEIIKTSNNDLFNHPHKIIKLIYT